MSHRTDIILIQHNTIALPEARDEVQLPRDVLATILTNIAYYGYGLSSRAIDYLMSCERADVEAWWPDIDAALKHVTGDDRQMADFVVYQNFPQEVLEMSQADYWFRQILMYWGLPNQWFTQQAQPREPIEPASFGNVPKMLHPANPQTLPNIYQSLLRLPSCWTPSQQEDVLHLSLELDVQTDLSEVPFKRNMVELGAFLIELKLPVSANNATDVLRLAAAMSKQDTSLRYNVRFRRFSRAERKVLLHMLEADPHLLDNLARRPEPFKRLFSRLHPGDWPERFEAVVRAYDALYNDRLPLTFNARLELALANKDRVALDLLKTRPGVFMRRLHLCLMLFDRDAAVAFVEVLPQLTTYQLVKTQRYLETINDRLWRTFPPRGNWNRLKIVNVMQSKRRRIRPPWARLILVGIKAELCSRLTTLAPSFAVDPRTEHIKLQTNDVELQPFGRGTAFEIPDEVTFIRTASYWSVEHSAYDVWFDNGWNFFDAQWQSKGVCCWDRSMTTSNMAVFSGDPTSSKEMQGRACQMIDLYLDRLVQHGVRYAVWSTLCFSEMPFSQATDVFAALQWGDKPQAGGLFEPSRCQLAFPLTGDNLTKFIAYIDLETRQLIFMDANLRGNVRSAGANQRRLGHLMPPFVEYLNTLPTVHDVFKHAPKAKAGLPILYSDVDAPVEGEAYVFRPEHEESSFEPLDLNAFLSTKGQH